jgi:S-adenosylmethionine:tRNA ribosyltransferase-isomerase
MNISESIRIEDYNYDLTEDRIAKFPLENRDQSKLLFYKKGRIEARKFTEIPNLLPKKSLLVFNETKVIRARLLFRKTTGALIEIFCLEPVEPSADHQLAFQSNSPVVWKCLVGNAKRWKSGVLEMPIETDTGKATLKAEQVEKLSDSFLVRFSWESVEKTFSEIIEFSGLVPLPPYLNREAVETDKARYQTVYARHDGSVAAPTAGLHFTERQFNELKEKGIHTAKVTLHVGAGTFRPVVSSSIAAHDMHSERIRVSLETLSILRAELGKNIIPVGTTSVRTLESLYWLAARLKKGDESFYVDQWDPYNRRINGALKMPEALDLLIGYLVKRDMTELEAVTRLIIVPGYQFKLCSGLVTNFHLPKSTLLLLVAAVIGSDWKKAYDFALQHDFRFLSYGDSCLFLP